MPMVTDNILKFFNGKENGGYDPIDVVTHEGAFMGAVLDEYPEIAVDIIISCINAHGLKYIDNLDEKYKEHPEVMRRISRYKLTTPVSEQ